MKVRLRLRDGGIRLHRQFDQTPESGNVTSRPPASRQPILLSWVVKVICEHRPWLADHVQPNPGHEYPVQIRS